MIKRLVVFTVIICACVHTQAQINLVRNAGFEQYITCPFDYDQAEYANYWNCIDSNFSPTSTEDPYCVPDYVNKCSNSVTLATTVPLNVYFYHYPHGGNGMMQVMIYYDETLPTYGNQRDYLQGRLYHPLTAGQSYCVTFYVVLEDSSGYAVNHIGAYLDNGSIDTASNCGLAQTEYTPQILDTTIIIDKVNWTKIQGSFVADGTERYITIGNFFDMAHTAHVTMPTAEYWSWYLIDDVSVIASDTTAYAGPDVSIARGDTAWIGVDTTYGGIHSGDGMPCYWYLLGGTAPIDSGGRIGVHPTDSTTYVVSLDLCGTVTYDTVRVNVSTEGVNPLTPQGGLSLFPNPAGEVVNITGAKNTTLVISDVMGREVYSGFIPTDKEIINIASFPDGVYMAHFTNAVSGVRIVKRLVKR